MEKYVSTHYNTAIMLLVTVKTMSIKMYILTS